MASRESQGLQVALILFVMVTVVLAVTTYLYFRRAEENVAEVSREGRRGETRKRHHDEAAVRESDPQAHLGL